MGIDRFQSVVVHIFHFVGLVNSVDVSTMESALPRVGVRCFMGGSHRHHLCSYAWYGQTLRMVNHRGVARVMNIG